MARAMLSALALATRELGAAFADGGVVGLGQFGDEIVGVGLRGGGDDFLAGRLGASVGEVLGDGAVEEERVLADDAEQPAVAVEPDFFERDAIEPDLAAGRPIKPCDQIGQSGLARTAGADKRDGGAVRGRSAKSSWMIFFPGEYAKSTWSKTTSRT